jgi:hypothetical protein
VKIGLNLIKFEMRLIKFKPIYFKIRLKQQFFAVGPSIRNLIGNGLIIIVCDIKGSSHSCASNKERLQQT